MTATLLKHVAVKTDDNNTVRCYCTVSNKQNAAKFTGKADS